MRLWQRKIFTSPAAIQRKNRLSGRADAYPLEGNFLAGLDIPQECAILCLKVKESQTNFFLI
jgi:hypothetical protein